MSGESISIKRMKYSKSDLTHLQKEDLVEKFFKLQNQVDYLIAKQQKPHEELLELKQNCSKMKAQLSESTQREGILVMRLTMKEQEVQELLAQIQEVKQLQNRGSTQLRSMILDPAVNLIYRQMQKEIEDYKSKLERAQGDISALKFTPESQTGKRLVAKCHSLMVENEEIGKMLSSGSIAKLEGELALEKQLVKLSRKTEEGCEKYLCEVDSELEEMQAALLEYQMNLKQCQEKLKILTDENIELKSVLKAKNSVNNDKPVVKKESKENTEVETRHDGSHKDTHTRHAAGSGPNDLKKKHSDKTSTGKCTTSKSSAPLQDAPHHQSIQTSNSGHSKNDLASNSSTYDRSKKTQETSSNRHVSSNSTDKRNKKHLDDRYDSSDKNIRTSDNKNKQGSYKNDNSDSYKSRKRNYDNVTSDDKSDDRRPKRHHFSSEDHDRTKPNVSDVTNGPKSGSSAQLLMKK